MAKIRVTENELKNIISESVKQVMKEGNFSSYGKNWEDLDPSEKERLMKRYRKWNIGYQDNAIGNDLGNPFGYSVSDEEKAKEIYNKKRNKKINRGKAVWTADQYNQQTQKFNTEIENLNKQIGELTHKNWYNLDTILKALKDVTLPNGTAQLEEQQQPVQPGFAPFQQQPGYLGNLHQRFQSATQPQQTTQPNQQAGSADTRLQTILAKINYLIGQANQIPGLNKTIANQKTQITNLNAELNQARAQSRIAQTPNPIRAANTRATQAQQNPAGLPQTTTQPRQVAGTYNTPVTQQGRPTA